MADDIIRYENIAVLSPTKKRFIKHFNRYKKNKRHFYIDDYINMLLDKEEADGTTN